MTRSCHNFVFGPVELTAADRGFTLVELLVVITIIIVLISLLTPALDTAIEHTERVVCASRLDAWGTALSQRAIDSKRKYFDTVQLGAGVPFPVAVNVTSPNTAYNNNANEVNVRDIEPYLPGYDREKHIFGQAWVCPSTGVEPQATWGFPESRNHFHAQYSYYANTDTWITNPPRASMPQSISSGHLGSAGVLMADTIYRWYDGSAFSRLFNHSTETAQPWINPVVGNMASITGVNRLYGDGGVEWNGRLKPEKIADLSYADPAIPWVSSSGNTVGGMNWY